MALLLVAACSACSGPGTGSEDVWWPRFPFDPAARAERDLAVILSSDNIGPRTTLAQLGYPGRLLFKLHEDHPRLRMVLLSCPASRYSGGRPVTGSPEAAETWRILALDPRFAWIELGNQGYTHAPEGDANLDHHEFSVTQSGCNLDHTLMSSLDYCRGRFRLAREAYRALGIPDERVVMVRFPGMQDSPQALQAAAEAGFMAVLGSRHPGQPGREAWTPHAGGGEILEIQNSKLLPLFARSEKLEAALAGGTISAAGATRAPEFLEAARRGRSHVDKVAAGGGILNLSDQWRETFAVIGGARPRYLVLDAVLRDIEQRYGKRVWYPGGRDLALWLQARRRTQVTARREGAVLRVEIQPAGSWRQAAPDGIAEASLVVRLPAGWEQVSSVTIREGEGSPRTLDPAAYWLHPRGLAVVFPLRGRARLEIKRGEP